MSSQFQPWQEGKAELTTMGIWQRSLYTLGDLFLSSRPGPKGFITKAVKEGRKGGYKEEKGETKAIGKKRQ